MHFLTNLLFLTLTVKAKDTIEPSMIFNVFHFHGQDHAHIALCKLGILLREIMTHF